MYKLLISMLILLNSLWASSSIGSVAGQFLEVNLHVRNMGMGNSGTSLVRGSSAMLVNPAGLSDLGETGMLNSYVSYLNWPADISFGALGVAYNLETIGTFGVSAVYVTYGDEIRTTPDMPFGDGTFSLGGMSIGLSFSRHITDKFSFGMTMKNVSESYDDDGYSQLAWDIGTLYRTGFHNLNIGMSILNFSKEAQFSGQYLDFSNPVEVAVNDSSSYDTWPLPMTFRTGISMDGWKNTFFTSHLAANMIHSNNSHELYGLGAELVFMNKYALRLGYQMGTDIQGLSLGGGIELIHGIRLDYAFNSMEYFGPRHRFGLDMNF
ncbi:MAG: PorV/PorQ family protein [Candidatus Marinimicrobia bacterium]|nr:PorV/PorQ family protein [Candidatus Neomarinimicrobiota bacterium]